MVVALLAHKVNLYFIQAMEVSHEGKVFLFVMRRHRHLYVGREIHRQTR